MIPHTTGEQLLLSQQQAVMQGELKSELTFAPPCDVIALGLQLSITRPTRITQVMVPALDLQSLGRGKGELGAGSISSLFRLREASETDLGCGPIEPPLSHLPEARGHTPEAVKERETSVTYRCHV